MIGRARGGEAGIAARIDAREGPEVGLHVLHGAEQTVDPHAHHKAGAKRLDMDVAGAKLDRALEQIVERAHHRRTAGEIAQAFDIVVGLLGRSPRGVVGHRAIRLGPLIQRGRDVLERPHRDLDRRGEDDFGGTDRCGIGGIGDRQAIGKVVLTVREEAR